MQPQATKAGIHRPQTVALAKATPAFISTPAASNLEPQALISYGKNDLFPNELLSLIGTSATATRCVAKRASYIEADGFADPDLAKMQIGSRTADTILHELANRMADLGAIALAVKYDRLGKVIEMRPLPVSCIRKRTDGNFILNYKYQSFTKVSAVDKDNIFLLKWEADLNPAKLAEQFAFLEEEGKGYEGHLYYDFDADTDKSTTYPVPEWVSSGGLADIEADAAASLLDKNAIRNGFKAGIHIHAVGAQYKDLTVVDTNGNVKEEDSPAMAGLKTAISDLKNPETDASVFLTTSDLAEEKVEVNPLSIGKAYDGMTSVTDRVAFKVCKVFGVNPLLVGLMVAGRLGNSTEMNEAATQLAKEVMLHQNIISRAFDRLLPQPNKNWYITSLASSNSIVEALATMPANLANQLIQDMTQAERRELLGLKPLTDVANNPS